MKPLYKKLSEIMAKEGIDVATLWKSKSPHFDGSLPHRYQATAGEYVNSKSKEVVCIYCLRPEKYDSK